MITRIRRLYDLLASGPKTARELSEGLEVSQSTFSRMVANDQSVVAFGQGRSTRYALSRAVRGIGACWRIYRVGVDTRHLYAGTLYAIEPNQFLWRDALNSQDKIYDSLPWFLWDARPQGFLGRTQYSDLPPVLNLPARILDWGDEDILCISY